MEPNIPTVVAPVKSALLSKTNITAALLGLLGLLGILTMLGLLPAAISTPEFVGGMVTAGAALVAGFRTFSKAVLKPSVAVTG